MHQSNPTEMIRERHLSLLHEGEGRHLARRLRAARSKRSERRMAGFERAIALWGRISIPFVGS